MRLRSCAALALCALLPAAAGAARADQRLQLLDWMQDELRRSAEKLKLPDHDEPYFIGYRLIDRESIDVEARFGALVENERRHDREVAVDVRVGDYRFDSSPDPEDLMFVEDPGFRASRAAPIDDDPAVLRGTLWLLTDQAYKQALASHLRKRAKKVTTVEDAHVDSFSREKPADHVDPPRRLEADRDAWTRLAREASARFRDHEGLLDGSVRISGERRRVFLVNNEGTRLVREFTIYAVAINAIGQAPDGMLLEQGQTLYGRTAKDMPDREALLARVDEALENIELLARAPVADPYTGPAILEPEATGVFFHEAVGHRLEGERQKDENEGRTFKGQLGTAILPDFITVRDDPTRPDFGGVPLNGHYPYDDQGVRARDVVLVKDGVLKTFLTSRTPIEDVKSSNGHGRAQGANRPMARMGNLIVEGSRPVSREKLKALLLEEVRRQGKPYGLIIRDITGGSTNTSNFGYQAFKGIPRMVFRVDAKTGEETLVRGVEMVGTPLTVVSKILATSDEMGVFNGYCGAESGYVPVSAVAPATLFKEIELQRSQKDKERRPILPPPWSERAQGEGAQSEGAQRDGGEGRKSAGKGEAGQRATGG